MSRAEIDGSPESWRESVRQVMEAFDRERRGIWRPLLEDDQALILGLYVDINDKDSHMALALTPILHELFSPAMWKSVRTQSVISTLARVVGQSRGAGDEHLTPECDGMMFAGAGVVLSECAPTRHLSSSSFYLYDRAGNFYVRRFMGGNQGEPEEVGGSIDTARSDEEANAQAEASPHFTDLHRALAQLVYACLSDPAECRQMYGENLFGELRDVMEKLRAQHDPTHPLNPNRVN